MGAKWLVNTNTPAHVDIASTIMLVHSITLFGTVSLLKLDQTNDPSHISAQLASLVVWSCRFSSVRSKPNKRCRFPIIHSLSSFSCPEAIYLPSQPLLDNAHVSIHYDANDALRSAPNRRTNNPKTHTNAHAHTLNRFGAPKRKTTYGKSHDVNSNINIIQCTCKRKSLGPVSEWSYIYISVLCVRREFANVGLVYGKLWAIVWCEIHVTLHVVAHIWPIWTSRNRHKRIGSEFVSNVHL